MDLSSKLVLFSVVGICVVFSVYTLYGALYEFYNNHSALIKSVGIGVTTVTTVIGAIYFYANNLKEEIKEEMKKNMGQAIKNFLQGGSRLPNEKQSTSDITEKTGKDQAESTLSELPNNVNDWNKLWEYIEENHRERLLKLIERKKEELDKDFIDLIKTHFGTDEKQKDKLTDDLSFEQKIKCIRLVLESLTSLEENFEPHLKCYNKMLDESVKDCQKIIDKELIGEEGEKIKKEYQGYKKAYKENISQVAQILDNSLVWKK